MAHALAPVSSSERFLLADTRMDPVVPVPQRTLPCSCNRNQAGTQPCMQCRIEDPDALPSWAAASLSHNQVMSKGICSVCRYQCMDGQAKGL